MRHVLSVSVVLVLATACVDRGDVGTFGPGATGPDGGDAATNPVATTTVTPFTSVLAASADTTCGLRASGAVGCWGSNREVELGVLDPTTSSATPLKPQDLPAGVRALAGGFDAQCALLQTGALWCWGDALFQRNSTGDTANLYTTPFPVQGFSNDIAQVSVGLQYACALLIDGRAKCWGLNGAGQLGSGGTGDNGTPADVVGSTEPFLAIAASFGGTFSCGITASSRIACWGANDTGQLGIAGSGTLQVTAPIDAIAGATSLVLGQTHGCVVTTDAKVTCWGGYAWGQLGPGVKSSAPRAIDGVPTMKAISAGSDFTCGASTTGGVWCWGRDDVGQIRMPTVDQQPPVQMVPDTFGATAVACGEDHCCAMSDARAVKCWGLSERQQTGAGSFSL